MVFTVSWKLAKVKQTWEIERKPIRSTPILSLPSITVSEMEIAELVILRSVQQFHFPEELELFSKSEDGKQVKKSTSLRRVDPILVNGVLRVGGRLNLASTAFEAKHQIILPKKDHMTNFVVQYYHQISGHSGREYVISLARARRFGS